MIITKQKCDYCNREVDCFNNQPLWIQIKNLRLALNFYKKLNDIEVTWFEDKTDLDFCNKECLNSYLKRLETDLGEARKKIF